MLLLGVQLGLARLLEVPHDVLADVISRFRLKHSYADKPGADTMRTWPEDIFDLASSLYDMGLPVHCLPVFGHRLFDPLDKSTDLDKPVSYSAFLRAIKRILSAAGLNPSTVGTHSFRRGGTAERVDEGASNAQVMQLLRHRSEASGRTYIMSAARSTALAHTCGSGPRGGMIVAACSSL